VDPVSILPEQATAQERAKYWTRKQRDNSVEQLADCKKRSFGDLTLVCGARHEPNGFLQDGGVQTADVSYVIGGNPPPPQLLRDGLDFYSLREGHRGRNLVVSEFVEYLEGVKRAFPDLIGAENYHDDVKKQNSVLHTLIGGKMSQVDALEKILQLYEEDPEHLANILCSTNTDGCTPLQLACEKKSDPMIASLVSRACSALSAIKVEPLDDEAVKTNPTRFNHESLEDSMRLEKYRMVYSSKPVLQRVLRLEDLLYIAKVSQSGFLRAMQQAPLLKCPDRVVSRKTSNVTKKIGDAEWTIGSQAMTEPGLWQTRTVMPVRSMLGSMFYGLPKPVRTMLKALFCVSKHNTDKTEQASTSKLEELRGLREAERLVGSRTVGFRGGAAPETNADGAYPAKAVSDGEFDSAGSATISTTTDKKTSKNRNSKNEDPKGVRILNPMSREDDDDEPIEQNKVVATSKLKPKPKPNQKKANSKLKPKPKPNQKEITSSKATSDEGEEDDLDERPVEAFVVSIFKAASFSGVDSGKVHADTDLLTACVHWCIRNHSTAIFECEIPKLLVTHKWRRYGSQLYQKQLLLYSCAVLQYSVLTVREDIFQSVALTSAVDTVSGSSWRQIRLALFAFTTSCNLLYFALKEMQQLKKEIQDLGFIKGVQEYFLDMWCVFGRVSHWYHTD
jgi:hypothetical protein